VSESLGGREDMVGWGEMKGRVGGREGRDERTGRWR
jgi:hypothetical protein